MKIVGVSGTNGSGKDTIGELLRDNFGWLYISASGDLIIPELQKRDLPTDRVHMAALTTEWRREIGMGAVVDKALEKAGDDLKNSKIGGLVIASLRHPGEAERIHGLGGYVVWVDADPKVRYERIYARKQGTKDMRTYDEFLADQNREMNHSGDKATLNIGDIKAKADIFIENNGNDLTVFEHQVEQALKEAKLLD